MAALRAMAVAAAAAVGARRTAGRPWRAFQALWQTQRIPWLQPVRLHPPQPPQKSFATNAPAPADAAAAAAGEDLMGKVVSLCKRRGFVYHAADVYGGLRGCYDYGPLGALLKRNLVAAWWHSVLDTRPDVVPLDSSILTHRSVLQTSGHVSNFSDPLVDCQLSKARFRADKAGPVLIGADGRLAIRAPDRPTAEAWRRQIAEQLAPGAAVERKGPNVVLRVVGQTEGALLVAPATGEGSPPVVVPYRGYVSPATNSPFLTPERQFNMMFATSLGAVDPIDEVVNAVWTDPAGGGDGAATCDPATNACTPPPPATRAAAAERARGVLETTQVYLRPETAQGTFTQFNNIVAATGLKLPFGVAQVGKSFRNEITLEHFIFRTAEFEQMELEYFCPPSESAAWFQYWRAARMQWWQALLPHSHDRLRYVDHAPTSLAHYSSACTDIEFAFPWGWGELEGVAHRGDYDLRAHAQATGRTMAALEADGRTRVTPHVIEPAAGVNRGLLAVLVDAYHERTVVPVGAEESGGSTASGGGGAEEVRVVLRLHPVLAPIKVAVCPLIKHEGMAARAEAIGLELRRHGISSRLEHSTSLSIGRRYARHDEIGTPWCVTVDHQTLEDGTVTVRDRDTMRQHRMQAEDLPGWVQRATAFGAALPLPPLRPQ